MIISSFLLIVCSLRKHLLLILFVCLLGLLFKQKKTSPVQSPPAPSSPLTSPDGDSGSTQVLKDGIGIAGTTAAVISTGKMEMLNMKSPRPLKRNNHIILCHHYS